MKKWTSPLVEVLSSLWLSAALLTVLALLTWLGTLEQVDTGLYEVQRKYFDSLFLVHRFGVFPLPLPGATLVMSVLFLNIVLGGILRMRRGLATLGVLVTHLGIVLLLLAGFVKAYFAEEGHVTLYEDESANTFQSYHRWELAVLEDLGDGRVREFLVPEERFQRATGAEPVRFSSEELPFGIELWHFAENARVLARTPQAELALPVVDGFFLEPRPRFAQNEANRAGAYVATIDRATGARTEGILWGAAREPLTVTAGARTFGIELRRERYVMPFTIELKDFVKEDHPRLDMPKAFSSDVLVVEDSTRRPVKIEMNEPLRSGGLVLYQSSWGPADARPGDRLFSTLAVVRNPADPYPLYACIVIAAGLALHFGRKLFRHIRIEAQGSTR